ncbi:MAG TPA: ROK family protein [Dehalococcoidales bacterium]
MRPKELFGGIEAGGTKFVCVIGTGPGDIRAMVHFPTTTPEETIRQAVGFFLKERKKSPVTAIGVGSFGPLDLSPASPTHGYITTTPKPGWGNTNIAENIRTALNVRTIIDTDVNCAALGEGKWGAAQKLDSFVYLTVGTGIGGGGLYNSRLMHGLDHPEMGHIRIPHDFQKDPYPGCCPFHGDCLEGLASGTALKDRWQCFPEDLPADHPAWDLEAAYLAYGLVNLIYILSPQRIIIGGGVMKQPRLMPEIRSKIRCLLGGYMNSPALNDLNTYLVSPGLGDLSGAMGAIALASEPL